VLGPRALYDVPLPHGEPLQLGRRTLVMGVINATPDSFADGGLRLDPAAAVEAAIEMEQQGADLIDIGGESTRPGAVDIPVEEETRRILPIFARLAGRLRIPLSVDTRKAEVARAALAQGASMVNDVSGLRYDSALAEVVAQHGAALVLMHSRGRSADMYREAAYRSVPQEVCAELGDSLRRAEGAGVPRDAILLDPGLGFAKRPDQTYSALAALPEFASLDRPLIVGPSRKSFLAAAIGDRPPQERDFATAASVTAAVLLGAHIVRVHAVREMTDVVRVADRVRAALGS
jgi:dihydropteroate synthase